MSKREETVALKQKVNCCQAVLLAYQKEMGLPEETLMAMGSPFGSGMGCMEGTCGALCGAEMVLGKLEFAGKPMHKDAKDVLAKFQEKCGATICKDLKGVNTGKVLCECSECVGNAVDVIEERRK